MFIFIISIKLQPIFVFRITTKNSIDFSITNYLFVKFTINIFDFLDIVKDYGISRLIYTDIEKDGTNTGPNFENSYKIADKFNIPLIISGGVSSMNDINKIISDDKKIEGIIVGKGIYENKIKLEELSKIN